MASKDKLTTLVSKFVEVRGRDIVDGEQTLLGVDHKADLEKCLVYFEVLWTRSEQSNVSR